MKTSRRIVLSVVAVLCLPPLVAGAEEKTQPPKTHALFMGADLVVQREKKLYRVEDVAGSEFMIHVDKQEVFVPTRNRQTGLQVSYNLKLSGASVKLDGLQSGPAYTPENDPMRKLAEASNNAAGIAAQQDMSRAQVDRAAANMASADAARPNSREPEKTERAYQEAKGAYVSSQAQMDYTTSSAMSDMVNVGVGAHQMQIAEGNFDAMEVSFKISSETELDRPYMVILFRFHEPTAKPGVDGMVIHAAALDPINATPRYVRVLRGGLPLGFKFVDCAVHIYNRGREVATNTSDKRVDLTRNEAQQYVVMEYVGASKGVTAPAGAVSGTLPLAQRQRLRPDQITRKVYAKVDKDGLMHGAFADEDCSHPLEDAGIVTALGEVFFKPALDQGKPVDGLAHVRLSDF